jgi:hypothetical protein
MPTYNQPKVLSDVLLVEVKSGWTKQSGLLSATALALAIGVVMAQKADGEYTPIDFAAAAPLNKAAAVLAVNVDESTSAQKTVFIKRGAVVASNELVFPDGATDEEIKTALAELEALGIVAEIAL